MLLCSSLQLLFVCRRLSDRAAVAAASAIDAAIAGAHQTKQAAAHDMNQM